MTRPAGGRKGLPAERIPKRVKAWLVEGRCHVSERSRQRMLRWLERKPGRWDVVADGIRRRDG